MIRPAHAADAAALAQLHTACFSPRGERVWEEAEWRELLEQSSTLCLMTDTDPPIAALLINHAGDEADIITIMTNPSSRRSGNAAALLGHAEKLLSERGCTRLVLEVAADNHPALALYRNWGFAQVGERRDYYRREGAAPTDALVLAKPI